MVAHRRTVRAEVAVAKIPIIRQRIPVGIQRGGREIHHRARRDGGRAGDHGQHGRKVRRKWTQVHRHIHRLRRGAPFADRRDVNVRAQVRESASDDERGISQAIGRPRRRVEQMTVLVPVAGPAQAHPVHQPFVRSELLSQLHPIVGGTAADDSQPAQPGGARIIVSVDPVGPIRSDVDPVRRGQPVEIVLVAGVEVIIAGTGGTHGIEAIPIFDVRARPNDALPGRVPEARVVQPVVVPQFMAGHSGGKAVVQPRARRAHVAEARPAETRNRPHANEVKLVLRQNEASRGRRAPGVRAKPGKIVAPPVIRRGSGHAKNGSHRGTRAGQEKARFAIRGFRVETAQAGDQRNRGVRSDGRTGQIREIDPDDQQLLLAFRVGRGNRLLPGDGADAEGVLSFGRDQSFVQIVGMDFPAQENDFAAHLHGCLLAVDRGGLARNRAQRLRRGHVQIGDLLRFKNASRAFVDGQEVVHGDPVQGQVGSRRFAQASSIDVSLVFEILELRPPEGQSHFVLPAPLRQGPEDRQRASTAHPLLEQAGNGVRQRPTDPHGDGQFQRLLRIGLDQTSEFDAPLAGKLNAFLLELLSGFRLRSGIAGKPIGKLGKRRFRRRQSPGDSGRWIDWRQRRPGDTGA